MELVEPGDDIPAKSAYIIQKTGKVSSEPSYMVGLLSMLSEKVWDVTKRHGWVECSYIAGADDSEVEITVNYPKSYLSRATGAVKEVLRKNGFQFKSKKFKLT